MEYAPACLYASILHKMLTFHKILYPVVEGEYSDWNRNKVHLKEGKYM